MRCVGIPRKMSDEGGDVNASDRPTIGGAYLHRILKGCDIFAAVSRNVCINAALNRTQKCGLTVISTADNHRNSGLDCHPAKDTRVGKLDLGLGSGGGSKRKCTLHGGLRDSAAASKNGTIGDERYPAAIDQDLLERAIILVNRDMAQQTLAFALNFGNIAQIVESILDRVRYVEVENLRGAVAKDCAASCGHTDFKTQFNAVGLDGAGTAIKNLDAGGHDLNVMKASLAQGTVECTE